jgi:hypothetical protein
MPVKDGLGGKRRKKAKANEEQEEEELVAPRNDQNVSGADLDVSLAREDSLDDTAELPPGALRYIC